jgi:hypothetical protein
MKMPFPHGTLFDFVHINIPAVRNLFAAGG